MSQAPTNNRNTALCSHSSPEAATTRLPSTLFARRPSTTRLTEEMSSSAPSLALEDESSSSNSNDDVTLMTGIPQHTPVSQMLDRAIQISDEMQIQMAAYYSSTRRGSTAEETMEPHTDNEESATLNERDDAETVGGEQSNSPPGDDLLATTLVSTKRPPDNLQ